MMREVVDAIVKRTEKFGGTGFQDWKFRIEMAVTGSCGRLHDFMEWAEDQELYIDPVTSVTEENSGYNSNLYYVLAQRTEGEAFDVVKKVAGQNGGEARRKLCRRFSGKTRGKRLHLIRKSDESEEAREEAQVPMRRKPAGTPTEEEVRARRVSHLPFRDWCPECVAGRAKDWPHRARNSQETPDRARGSPGLLLHSTGRWRGLQCGAGGEGPGDEVDLGTCCSFQRWRERVGE